MNKSLFLAAGLAFGAGQALATDCLLSADDWARPRSGEMVRTLAPVATCVRAWMRDPQQRLVLIHAPSEAGGLWAVELRDWLVALGVTSAAVDLRAVGRDGELTLRVEARRVGSD